MSSSTSLPTQKTEQKITKVGEIDNVPIDAKIIVCEFIYKKYIIHDIKY